MCRHHSANNSYRRHHHHHRHLRYSLVPKGFGSANSLTFTFFPCLIFIEKGQTQQKKNKQPTNTKWLQRYQGGSHHQISYFSFVRKLTIAEDNAGTHGSDWSPFHLFYCCFYDKNRGQFFFGFFLIFLAHPGHSRLIQCENANKRLLGFSNGFLLNV